VNVDELKAKGMKIRKKVYGTFALNGAMTVLLIATHFASKIPNFDYNLVNLIYAAITAMAVLTFLSFQRTIKIYDKWKSDTYNHIENQPEVLIYADEAE
jgi:hypothetical protein